MKELVGKKIKHIWIAPDQETLVFETDSTPVTYRGYGDCCSETWFADITGVQSLIGATVITVEEVDINSVQDGRSRQKEDSFYGVKIKTDKGDSDIIYRNSSNGYYGGYAEFVDTQPDMKDFKEIIEDWSV